MHTQLATTEQTQGVISLVLDAVTSPHTKRDYGRALRDFLSWYQTTGQQRLDKATVQRYVAGLHELGASPANINQRLSAIRRFAQEAADNGLISDQLATGIGNVKGVKQEGLRAGNWLDKQRAQELINAPNTTTLKGLRDRAILAVMVGCGLRRSEVANLTVQHIQQRDGRWCIVDLVGKRGRVRTIPMPSWAKAAIDEWTRTGEVSNGRLFRGINKGDYVAGNSMTDQAIANVVRQYASMVDATGIAAHDLRRTYAKLSHKGGAALEQIQLSLGHSSIRTTERYLGVDQDLTDAPCDHLGLRLE